MDYRYKNSVADESCFIIAIDVLTSLVWRHAYHLFVCWNPTFLIVVSWSDTSWHTYKTCTQRASKLSILVNRVGTWTSCHQLSIRYDVKRMPLPIDCLYFWKYFGNFVDFFQKRKLHKQFCEIGVNKVVLWLWKLVFFAQLLPIVF